MIILGSIAGLSDYSIAIETVPMQVMLIKLLLSNAVILIAIVGATGVVEAKQTAELNWQTTGRVEHVFTQMSIPR